VQRARSWRRWALLAAEEEEVVLEEVVVLSKVPLAVEEMGKFGTRAAWSVVVDEAEEGYLLLVRVDGDAHRESARDMDVEMLVKTRVRRTSNGERADGRVNSGYCRLDVICKIVARWYVQVKEWLYLMFWLKCNVVCDVRHHEVRSDLFHLNIMTWIPNIQTFNNTRELISPRAEYYHNSIATTASAPRQTNPASAVPSQLVAVSPSP